MSAGLRNSNYVLKEWELNEGFRFGARRRPVGSVLGATPKAHADGGAVIWKGSGDAWDKASDGASGPPEETQDSAEGTAG